MTLSKINYKNYIVLFKLPIKCDIVRYNFKNFHIGDEKVQEITYRIYSDESVSDGKYYSNFYGRSSS